MSVWHNEWLWLCLITPVFYSLLHKRQPGSLSGLHSTLEELPSNHLMTSSDPITETDVPYVVSKNHSCLDVGYSLMSITIEFRKDDKETKEIGLQLTRR
jgi:hypothetical protein